MLFLLEDQKTALINSNQPTASITYILLRYLLIFDFFGASIVYNSLSYLRISAITASKFNLLLVYLAAFLFPYSKINIHFAKIVGKGKFFILYLFIF
jgi:hypothetical protein